MELKVNPRKIKALRHGKSWSQEELADKAAVSLRTVQRMELDGSASLKSRRAVAEAFKVEPTSLDPQSDEQGAEASDRARNGPLAKKKTGFWSTLFAYPGPSKLPGKIRSPLIIALWIGMVISGGPLLLAILGFAILSILNPENSHQAILLASVPLFVVFLVFLGLYQFFRSPDA